MQPLLTFLIPSTPDRKEETERLVFEITRQCGYSFVKEDKQKYNCDILHIQFEHKPVELYVFTDNKKLTIGEKRELMYGESKGLYSVQWDSDDWMHHEAIDLIIQAIESNPEVSCITYEELIDIDGKREKSNHSLDYGGWEGEGGSELWDGFHYHRTPFMKSVIKTSIARKIPVPALRFGEDHEFAKQIYPHLKSQIHIDLQLYHYIHRSTNFNERYGYDRD